MGLLPCCLKSSLGQNQLRWKMEGREKGTRKGQRRQGWKKGRKGEEKGRDEGRAEGRREGGGANWAAGPVLEAALGPKLRPRGASLVCGQCGRQTWTQIATTQDNKGRQRFPALFLKAEALKAFPRVESPEWRQQREREASLALSWEKEREKREKEGEGGWQERMKKEEKEKRKRQQ